MPRAQLVLPVAQELRARLAPQALRARQAPRAQWEPPVGPGQRVQLEIRALLVQRGRLVPPEPLALAGQRVPPVTQDRSVLLARPALSPGLSSKEAHRSAEDLVAVTRALAALLGWLQVPEPPSIGPPCRIKDPGEIVPFKSWTRHPSVGRTLLSERHLR